MSSSSSSLLTARLQPQLSPYSLPAAALFVAQPVRRRSLRRTVFAAAAQSHSPPAAAASVAQPARSRSPCRTAQRRSPLAAVARSQPQPSPYNPPAAAVYAVQPARSHSPFEAAALAVQSARSRSPRRTARPQPQPPPYSPFTAVALAIQPARSHSPRRETTTDTPPATPPPIHPPPLPPHTAIALPAEHRQQGCARVLLQPHQPRPHEARRETPLLRAGHG